MNVAERIERLRELVVERKRGGGPARVAVPLYVSARSLRDSESEASWQVRRGMLTRDRLHAMHFVFGPWDGFAGTLADARHTTSDEAEREAAEYLKAYPGPPGQTGHCELYLDLLLEQGIAALLADIQGRMKGADAVSQEAYRSFAFALDGLSGMIENAAADAEAASRDDLAVSCRRIAHDAPASFRDAIQLLWFALLGVMEGEHVGLVVPGHLDRILYPFYKADIASERLTRDEALSLVAHLYLYINDYIPDGLAMSVMVGGRDADGRDVTNELSHMCLEALPLTRMIYPTVGVCWHERTPESLTRLAVGLMGKGCPTPAFFGDDTIQRGLRALGVPDEEACRYINSTCVEITPCGSSNVWVASPYFSTCKILLDEIAEQLDSGTVAASFQSFQERYYARLARHIEEAVACENENRRKRRQYGGKPLQSVFTRDCIARGRDIDDGGARYNWVECSFVGLANLADSLHVIREEVFSERGKPLAELKASLDANFAGHEAERQRLLRRYPKYGQDESCVDALFADTISFVQKECARHRMDPDGSPFVPGAFCWIMHEILGRECGATPDGRLAGVPFADGCGPAQGRETKGPTAAVLSTTSWDHSPMIGGLAFNMKFNQSLFETPAGFDALEDLVSAFLRRGGFETQVNVVNAETLRKARAHPDSYRDLVVRIGGYCDYFTRLSPQMQDEVILRTEYARI